MVVPFPRRQSPTASRGGQWTVLTIRGWDAARPAVSRRAPPAGSAVVVVVVLPDLRHLLEHVGLVGLVGGHGGGRRGRLVLALGGRALLLGDIGFVGVVEGGRGHVAMVPEPRPPTQQ